MSTGPILDHFWLFVAGVVAAPVLGAYATDALVRWWTARRGFAVEASRRSLAGLVLALFVVVPLLGGLVLHATRGIPPGLGFLGTLLFLLAAYGGPVALGAVLFGRFVAARLSAREGADAETRVGAGRAATEAGLWFVGAHLALFPALYALAIIAS